MNKPVHLQNAYFVTLSMSEREALLGTIQYETTRLSSYGEIVQQCWQELTEDFPELSLDVLAILPDHVHGVLVLNKSTQDAITEVVGEWKDRSTAVINRVRLTPQQQVWQEDQFILPLRTASELFKAREFVVNNAHLKHTRAVADRPFAEQ